MISIEHISKQYRLGTIGTGSLRQDMQQWLKMRMKKSDDAFFRDLRDTDHGIWALKNVSFQLGQGESIGIIGSNGSGKSTLLKIISRIVEPTAGRIRGSGRISSMLEVGTGFHQELTGRENIFMSGYTLGMQKAEIRNKFDEIVAFSGVEQFLDTPVKRYSSGMYVRLAFAVAAHLEPDILIVDEVLAVGDADFQRKCMGKMQDSSTKDGRTVIFVSHNMPAVEHLCVRALWLSKGTVTADGPVKEVVSSYLSGSRQEARAEWKDGTYGPGNASIRLRSIEAKPLTGHRAITVRSPVQVCAGFVCNVNEGLVNINVQLFSPSGVCIFNIGTPAVAAAEGLLCLDAKIPGNLLNNATYSISLTVMHDHASVLCEFHDCLRFEVDDVREGISYFGEWPGLIRPQIDTSLTIKTLQDAGESVGP